MMNTISFAFIVGAVPTVGMEYAACCSSVKVMIIVSYIDCFHFIIAMILASIVLSNLNVGW